MKQLLVFAALLGLVFCAGSAFAQDAAKGKLIYDTICTVCHGPDPKVDGPLGPAISGSSEELLRLRVLLNKYPDGYTPKRDTKMMPPFPQYKDDIGHIHAFLNQ